MTPEEIDALSKKTAVAPRVALVDIENYIDHEWTVQAHDCHPARFAGVPPQHLSVLETTTMHFMIMRNGFLVIGHSTPASPENYNPKLGRQLARDQCIKQLWPLMGFALRSKLVEDDKRFGQPHHGHKD